MIRLKITSNKHGVVTKEFNDEIELEAYLTWMHQSEHWGAPAKWIQDPREGYTETREVPDPNSIPEDNITITEYLMPAEYSCATEDITSEIRYAKELAKRKKRIELAHDLFAELAVRNVERLKAGETTLDDILEVEVELAQVQRRLLNSTTEVALLEMQQLPLVKLPPTEKTYFISKIQNYLAAEE